MASLESSKRIGSNLTEGSIFKKLLFFAGPIILTNLIQQMYSLVDLIIIGRFVGSIGTVGVTVGGELSDLMTPIATSFATAGQIYIAQLVGASDNRRIKESIGTLLTLMMIISVVCSFLAIAFNSQILHLLNCPPEAFSQAQSYMIITAFGLPFIFGYNAVCGILRGFGESKKMLFFIIIAALLNIFTDLFLVAGVGMEAAGTAIATVFSQIGAFAAAMYHMYKSKDQFELEFSHSYFKLRKEPALIIIKLGIPQLVRTSLVHASMLWVNSNINAYGIIASATNSVGNKIQKFLNAFMNGVDTASAAMIAQNLGAKKHSRAKRTLLYTLAACIVIAAVSSTLALILPRELYSIFTSDPQVIEFGVIYMQIMVMTFFMSAFTGSMQTMVTGSGFVSLGYLLGILDGMVCRIGFSLLFLHVFDYGVISFFWGTAFSRTIPGIICLIYFLSGKWRTRKLVFERRL